MSFSESHEWIFSDGILPALNETGFEPLKVDEDKTLKYRNPENTINDFILFSIRQSKFCIADYTGNKNGVYFETGYALAKGKEVIYTCQESDFAKVHFDTNRFPFIRYKSADELKEKLIYRIKETLL
jgi:nucleoside 2-deoxyribosyltransferase